ncbi:hypothetical protein PITCH_A2030159 [uncultured Desulfobacterium sp.]|uniref:Uncharacterized protein n=1 Tax=uncultured Desulfobacterium sp. TaxID=201089 RepID=A0A445MX28_9BACT|nr:hypothetical protein PITCH_A2030159 [uncultured Desulfobacterium sp.]
MRLLPIAAILMEKITPKHRHITPYIQTFFARSFPIELILDQEPGVMVKALMDPPIQKKTMDRAIIPNPNQIAQ